MRSETVELARVTLDDKYTLSSGRVFLSGIQALVRLPMMQRERDRAAGLNTAGFISGYRGSPLAGYDRALWQARKFLERHDVRFQPGLNEDLAATAVWGSQQVGLFPGATVDGVFAIWYGKGPGVDRSMDAIKHANAAGTSPHGGVLALAGDDHGAQSSTMAHQSEHMFEAAMMPILNPASVQEYLDFGLLGFALSRCSGCWVGFKTISETVESSAVVDVDPHRVEIAIPVDFEMPSDGVNIRWPRGGMDWGLEQERRLHGPKMAAVAAFARANRLDWLVTDPPQPRLGVLTTGKAYLDLRQALADLGIDEATAAALGLRIYKVGLTWPIEADGARRFAEGLTDVLVVEEKRGFIENQLVRLLYNMPAERRPSVVGKTDETGAPLLPTTGELTPAQVARALVARLQRFGDVDARFAQRLARIESLGQPIEPTKTQRIPFFCSGCPHNTSTRLPEGSRAMPGIGCHGLAMLMPARNTMTITQMGGEGANWIGQAPFTTEKHVFQNLGDGTYSHSGLIAIRAAAVAGVNITYKILYNDAVAMTGGQPVEGHLTVPDIARQVLAEGAKRVVVMSDEPDKYSHKSGLPDGVEIRHRDDLDAVQRALRDTPGLTVLIYDQTCAAEKRRRRKRGLYPDPPQRVFINDAVCEGCGDCSDQSNCISVRPLETEFGRKREIDQSNCNKDFSCIKGFCPSFVTVHGGALRKGTDATVAADLVTALPLPQPRALDEPYAILIAGIGGTGIITVGALLGMAAHLEGRGCTLLDFTGLSQKNGAVMSHVRIAATPDELHSVRIAAGGADLLIGCDMVAATSATALACMETRMSKAVVNSFVQPTAAFVLNPDLDFETAMMQRALRSAVGDAGTEFIDATGLATALVGDAIGANLFLLGYAFQRGLIPLGLDAIMRAIELNGVMVEDNTRAFAWGRLAAHDRAKVEAVARPDADAMPAPEDVAGLVARHAAVLADYQDAAYAQRYREAVAAVEAAEIARGHGLAGLAETVARNLFKLMAYKDEYEVARLYTNGAFLDKLRRRFEGDIRLSFHLAPPLIAARDPATGELKKRAYGAWMFNVFQVVARLRRLRGTRLDIFGYTAERRMERRLIAEYQAIISELAAGLSPDNHALALKIASLPEQIRGFGHVKARNAAKAKAREAELLALWRGETRTPTAA
jgi:indolepyruvate ferredoxin oxidoreductase